MRILITNDDGILAEGLTALERIAAQLSDDVWVVAPELEQSGASRALTLSAPVRVRRLDDRRFAVSGTPTDCVMLAMAELVEGRKPDLVLSGVNRGQNLGEDITVSGTVAGAIQGMVYGMPSIALSQCLTYFEDRERAYYETAEAYAPGIIQRLLKQGWSSDVVMNLNFPDLPPDQIKEVEVTRQGRRDIEKTHAERRMDLRGRAYYWMNFEGRKPRMDDGSDIAAIAKGRISVTPIHIDLTHQPTVHALKAVLGGPPPKLDA